MARPDDFSLTALYAALDARRRALGLTWAQATSEINRSVERASRVSMSTVTGTRNRAVAEGDGVLQMLLWLDRTPESFVPGHPRSHAAGARLPDVPPGRILRFDMVALHAALDARRVENRMTWAEVAKTVGLGAASLPRLAQGGRTSFPQVMRMTGWLGRPAAHFTRVSDR